MKASRVWAITCYFPFDDPSGYQRRLRAYRQFRRRLQVPLATVELARDGRFHLEPSDADTLIQIAGGATLWQKERLLNVALAALPSECDTVVWIDGDVVIPLDDWPEAVNDELERSAIVQPFINIHYLAETEPTGPLDRVELCETRNGVVPLLQAGALPPESFRERGWSDRLNYSPGLAWAARRSLLDQHGFYDCMILGAGDKALFSAACGYHREYARAYCTSDAQAAHYLCWAEGYAEAVGGRVGYIEGDAYHLYHGELKGRNYSSRHEGFEAFQFDPKKDLRLGATGAWEWAGGKPEMQEFARVMFERRKGAAGHAA